jgi:ornithine cyclodeaminase/alanine dehydrogenase-like protein (mu-crystallin family)
LTNNKVDLLFLNAQEVAALISVEDVVFAVEETFRADGRGEIVLGPAEPMPVSKQGWLMAMPAAVASIETAGVKWLGYFDRGKDAPYPTTWGNILILNRTDNGLPFAIMDCTQITAMRTAGGHAVVAAKHLAKKNPKTLGVLGCGAQARAGSRAFDTVFDLEEIRLYAKTPAHAEALAKELSESSRARITVAENASEIAEGADLLLTASSANSTVIREEWIGAGCTVTAVSAFSDLDPALSRKADKWILGKRESDNAHIVRSERFSERLDEADVYGTLGEILAGERTGRDDDTQRILFTHMGMGALDTAVGKRVYDRAIESGSGQWIRLA